MRKTALIPALIFIPAAMMYAGSVTITAFPYDSLLMVMDAGAKDAGGIITKDNAPAFLKEAGGRIRVCGSKRGYDLRDCPEFEVEPGQNSFYIELKPVTRAAEAMLEKAKNSTDALNEYPELFPMLTGPKFYGYFHDDMAKQASKEKNFSPSKIAFETIYKDVKNGVYATTAAVIAARAGGKENPIAPSSPEESSVKNRLKLYLTGPDGKLKYVYTHNCARFSSFNAVFDRKKGATLVREEYVSKNIVKPGVEIFVLAEYSIDAVTSKISYNKFTYFTKEPAGLKPVVKKVTAGIK
ncbi:MAG: hypothetical protein LLG37_09815 [Spirochaetia bacterium]|nr:hypothetical protein [Spirochaetia bacterium]